ncbi:MAG TPA: transposase domain-containing protein, partial [Novosphingobium sp.]|nr:transposase domain-containing protein [Novosphingobium sp.]
MKPSTFSTAGGAIATIATDTGPEPGETGPRDWFGAAELAALALPGLPADKRSLNRRAKAERWDVRCDSAGEPLARLRRRNGGGVEYHVSLLPADTRLELARRGLSDSRPEPRAAEAPAVAAWRWYEAQTAKVKAEAERRATIIATVDLLLAAGMTKTAAVAEASRRHGVGKATVWEYLDLVEGVARHDRLPALAPKRKGGGREADISDQVWQIFLSDYLRPEKPTLTSCYDRAAAIAASRGEAMPSERSIRRKLDRDVDARVILLNRGGKDEFERSIPDARRTLDGLHAMHIVNVDGHQFDVFVKSPEGKIVRPVLVAIQDVYSSKMLAWRIDLSENYLATRLAFADLFRNFGIPKICLLDNSRTFAGKQLTGGAKTRYRYKVKEEEPAGLLVSLGIEVRFATIYHGQSKPIERAFRDISDRISRGPECAGAYTGNRPTAKPANYGSRAVDWDVFVQVVDRGIALHNAKLGRRGRDYRGRSFDQVFADSYAAAPIGKATPEQLRMALLA